MSPIASFAIVLLLCSFGTPQPERELLDFTACYKVPAGQSPPTSSSLPAPYVAADAQPPTQHTLPFLPRCHGILPFWTALALWICATVFAAIAVVSKQTNVKAPRQNLSSKVQNLRSRPDRSLCKRLCCNSALWYYPRAIFRSCISAKLRKLLAISVDLLSRLICQLLA